MDFVDDLSGGCVSLSRGLVARGIAWATSYVLRSSGGVLAESRSVDGVIDLSAGQLTLDVIVHGAEARGLALRLAGPAGVDDGWDWALVRRM